MNISFNSIKVQLERLGEQPVYVSEVLFQFHKGAIRTFLSDFVNLLANCFNSIKVQLELNTASSQNLVNACFNSIKVQLELTSFVTSFSNRPRFNSIKVQLELELEIDQPGVAMFQFHKGAIRTVASGEARLHGVVFQFHKGAIRTVRIRQGIRTLCGFNSIKVQLEQSLKYISD